MNQLGQIQHIVVLMLENRSFDHEYGTFPGANGIYSDPFGWFGLPSGVTQNNPTGIASTDGTNFWGTGNVTGIVRLSG